MKYIYLSICLLISNVYLVNAQEMVSPNKKIKIIVTSQKESDEKSFGQPLFKVVYNNSEVIANSTLGIIREDEQFTDNLKLIGESKTKEVNQQYEMVSGKRKLCANLGTEKVLQYVNSNNKPLNIVFRVYNDGVAFRYEFPEKEIQ